MANNFIVIHRIFNTLGLLNLFVQTPSTVNYSMKNILNVFISIKINLFMLDKFGSVGYDSHICLGKNYFINFSLCFSSNILK